LGSRGSAKAAEGKPHPPYSAYAPRHQSADAGIREA
jgi:hypothetical protein